MPRAVAASLGSRSVTSWAIRVCRHGCVNPIWPHLLRRFLAVVATPDRFGSCDGTPGTGGAAASREAGAVRAADRAGVQQPGGVPDRRDQPADRETVATRPHD